MTFIVVVVVVESVTLFETTQSRSIFSYIIEKEEKEEEYLPVL